MFAEHKTEPVAPKPATTKPVQPKPIEMKPAPIAPRVPIALNSDPSSWAGRWVPSIVLLGSSAVLASGGAMLWAKRNDYAANLRDIEVFRKSRANSLSDAECIALNNKFNETHREYLHLFRASAITFGAAGALGIAGLVYPWLPIHGKSTSIAVSNSSVLIRGSF